MGIENGWYRKVRKTSAMMQRFDDDDDGFAQLVAGGSLAWRSALGFRTSVGSLLPPPRWTGPNRRGYGTCAGHRSTGSASMMTKACAMPPSSVMVRWIWGSCPAGTRRASTRAAPLVRLHGRLARGQVHHAHVAPVDAPGHAGARAPWRRPPWQRSAWRRRRRAAPGGRICAARSR